MASTRLNRIYRLMKNRCTNPKNPAYKYYGGRGINVCSEWLNSEKVGEQGQSKGWIEFKKWALCSGYQEGLTIDRIDVNSNYEPSNCRWVSMKVQHNNTRRNLFVTYKGEIKTIANWCEILNLKYNTVYTRIVRYHWTIERALETRENPVVIRSRI